MSRLPHLVGDDGPAVVVPARIAAVLERYADLSSLRVRTRGVDPEATAVLEALRYAAMSWRSSACAEPRTTPRRNLPQTREWLDTGEAADLAGVTSRAIRKAIKEARLPATKVGGWYRISREDLEHYKAARAA
ncbi:MAG TPA: helix-turn-helix domain-containing protein [Nocardioides sp.]|uniref:helix-turn-helix domain-containing protein n=1 Tax=Nocardioides sp. TaxID=35761 RepID=UPI002F40D277